MDYGGAQGNHLKAKAGASKRKRVKFKIRHGSAENQDSSDTLSPSSSDSSSDDFFQVNPQILPKFRLQNMPPHSNGGSKAFYENDEIDVSSEALYRMEESINGSPGSTSQFSDITHESLMPQFSPIQSPPIQIMGRPVGFDPNRIPASVFSKSSTPTEWSVASNDSLFSIHIGNGSFPRDHVSRIDLDLPKSGELLKSGESSESPKRSGELIRFGPTSPTFKGIEPYFDIEKTISGHHVKPEEIRTVGEPINDGPKKGAMNNNHVDTIVRESRDSYGAANGHSDKREIQVQPFAKPIACSRKKKSSCPLCHCHDCCQAFCGCKWLACSCKWLRWPSCSFKWCVWPSCSKNCSSCHCKCLNLSSCCCKCPNWSSCCCKCPNWSSFCCKCSSWSCCKCSSWSCCKCSFWSCFKCTSWSCCKCQCSNCTWACCYCWNRERKTSSYDSSIILTDGGLTNSKSSTKASSRRKCSCFSCSSSCSCCSCWSFSCCC